MASNKHAMRVPLTHPPDLERALLRKSVDALAAGRHRCRDCRRTPLIGERVFTYAGGRTVCELCRALRREEPVRLGMRHQYITPYGPFLAGDKKYVGVAVASASDWEIFCRQVSFA